jgi:hypothetical protein
VPYNLQKDWSLLQKILGVHTVRRRDERDCEIQARALRDTGGYISILGEACISHGFVSSCTLEGAHWILESVLEHPVLGKLMKTCISPSLALPMCIIGFFPSFSSYLFMSL